MKLYHKAVLLGAYGISSFLAFGALNADLKCRSEFSGRHDMAVAMGYAMLPVIGPVVAVFSTGFLECGWSLRIQKDSPSPIVPLRIKPASLPTIGTRIKLSTGMNRNQSATPT